MSVEAVILKATRNFMQTNCECDDESKTSQLQFLGLEHLAILWKNFVPFPIYILTASLFTWTMREIRTTLYRILLMWISSKAAFIHNGTLFHHHQKRVVANLTIEPNNICPSEWFTRPQTVNYPSYCSSYYVSDLVGNPQSGLHHFRLSKLRKWPCDFCVV